MNRQRVKVTIMSVLFDITIEKARKLAGRGYKGIYKKYLQWVITTILASLTTQLDTLQKIAIKFPTKYKNQKYQLKTLGRGNFHLTRIYPFLPTNKDEEQGQDMWKRSKDQKKRPYLKPIKKNTLA